MRSQHVTSSSIPFPLASPAPAVGTHFTLPTYFHGNRILTDQLTQHAFSRTTAYEHSNAAQIANVATTTWMNIYLALSPVIGQKGVSAIYKRSLSLARRDYPWLMYAQECKRTEGDFTALRTTLALQPSKMALAGHRSLFGHFYNLLRHLIGNELTKKILQHVKDHDLNG